MKVQFCWLFAKCLIILFIGGAACARPSANTLAPSAPVSAGTALFEDLEVVVARQTIEEALTGKTSTPTPTDTLLPVSTPTITPDQAAIQTLTFQTMATAVAATLTAQSLPTNIALPEPGALDKNPRDDATIIYIPDGEFIMGLTEEQINDLMSICSECQSSNFAPSKPVHKVYVSSFWIYRTEVTNRMYAQCVNNGMCRLPTQTRSETRSDYWSNPAYADYPVVYVDWFSADQYCRWAGGRLPTEAEWEKAARGNDARLFPWGNTSPDSNLANTKNSIGDTTPVGSYPEGESVYSVQDMAGNVWEWVADWYEPDYYKFSAYENPLGPDNSNKGYRSGRGGSWYWAGAFASSAYHDWWEPDQGGSGVGFRCAIDLN